MSDKDKAIDQLIIENEDLTAEAEEWKKMFESAVVGIDNRDDKIRQLNEKHSSEWLALTAEVTSLKGQVEIGKVAQAGLAHQLVELQQVCIQHKKDNAILNTDIEYWKKLIKGWKELGKDRQELIDKLFTKNKDLKAALEAKCRKESRDCVYFVAPKKEIGGQSNE